MLSSAAPARTPLLSELNDLLDSIGEKLQISPTAHREARDRYQTIADWLGDEGSPLAPYDPQIYSQGSLRIGTTVKPRGEDEYDLDLVCVLNADPVAFPDPTVLLDLVEQRLRSNATYDTMIERKNRCIRLSYAGKFHMDILPACPSPTNTDFLGEHALKVPDCNLGTWKDSNPKGFACWFEAKAEAAVISFREKAEPLPVQQAYEDLETLKRITQLMKRNRDVSLEKLELKWRPISVVITTLAARHYTGTPSVIDGLEQILTGIKGEIDRASLAGEDRIVVLNPTNELEDLSERWTGNKKLYEIFTTWIDDLIRMAAELKLQPGLPEISKHLESMFGEKVTKDVVEDYIKRVSAVRREGDLATAFQTGVLVTTGEVRSTPVEINNFHGEG